MRPETFKLAKECYEARVERRGASVPRNRLGWFIRLHFTDDGQFAIADAVQRRNATVPALEPPQQLPQSPLPLEPQSGDLSSPPLGFDRSADHRQNS
jgi:hypothetical protein